jgi:hypothetical protein
MIKEDPESQYHLLQGSSGLFYLWTAETDTVVHPAIIMIIVLCVRNCPFLPAGWGLPADVFHQTRETKKST